MKVSTDTIEMPSFSNQITISIPLYGEHKTTWIEKNLERVYDYYCNYGKFSIAFLNYRFLLSDYQSWIDDLVTILRQIDQCMVEDLEVNIIDIDLTEIL